MKLQRIGCVLAGLFLFLTPAAPAADNLEDIRVEMERMKKRIDEQERTIQTLRKTPASKTFDQLHKEELQTMMKEILDDAKLKPASPKWMKNLKFFGDLRLRYQHDSQAGSVGVAPNEASLKDRNRMRFRLRFGFQKTWWEEQMKLVFRLASQGNGFDSSNETFDGWFNKKALGIDLAYVTYAPKWLKGFEITGGKMKNPIATKTLMTHDGDINWEGIHTRYTAPFWGDFKPYAGVGFWSLEDQTTVTGSDTIYSQTIMTYELGYNWKLAKDLSHFLGATYYDYDHLNARATRGGAEGGIDGNLVNDVGRPNADAGLFELTTHVKWKMFNLPWKAGFSWVHNARDTYSNSNGNGDDDFEGASNGYCMSLKVGKNKKKGDWSIGYTYAHVGAHAVTPIRDSDFFAVAGNAGLNPLGNVKGSIFGVKYNLDDFLTLGGKVIFCDLINSNAAIGGNHDLDSLTTVQLDLVWKF